MSNTSANTFNQKGANHVTEYKGYTITRSSGRRGFTIKPKHGEVPRVLRGQWLKLEKARDEIDAYLDSPAGKKAEAQRIADAERKERAKAGADKEKADAEDKAEDSAEETFTDEEYVDAEGDSQ